MSGKISILIYSQQELLFNILDKQRRPFHDLMLFPVWQAQSAILFLNDPEMYPLILVADESADIQALKTTLLSLKHHGKAVFAIHTGSFSSKQLAMSFSCGFDEFLATSVSLKQIIQFASRKASQITVKTSI